MYDRPHPQSRIAHPALSALLFDLDGTLSDPLEGITRSIQHALTHLGGVARTQTELAVYIGPPLRGTFGLLLETEDPLVIEQAMTAYRERFGVIGLFENELYRGVPEMLQALRERRYALYLATAKPRIFAERILAHFDLAQYFSGVYGSELDGRFDNKADLVAYLLEQEQIAPEAAAMVGDRRHDVIAARENGLLAVGVTYGYGSADELTAAGADVLCHTPDEIVTLFCGGLGVGGRETGGRKQEAGGRTD